MKNNLKEARIALGLTQKEVAEKLGISFRAYQNYELGLRTPNIYQAKKIAKVLQTDVNILFP